MSSLSALYLQPFIPVLIALNVVRAFLASNWRKNRYVFVHTSRALFIVMGCLSSRRVGQLADCIHQEAEKAKCQHPSTSFPLLFYSVMSPYI